MLCLTNKDTARRRERCSEIARKIRLSITYQMTKPKYDCTKSHVHTTATRLHNRTVAIYIVRYPSWLHISPSTKLRSPVNTPKTPAIFKEGSCESTIRRKMAKRQINNAVTGGSWEIWCHRTFKEFKGIVGLLPSALSVSPWSEMQNGGETFFCGGFVWLSLDNFGFLRWVCGISSVE